MLVKIWRAFMFDFNVSFMISNHKRKQTNCFNLILSFNAQQMIVKNPEATFTKWRMLERNNISSFQKISLNFAMNLEGSFNEWIISFYYYFCLHHLITYLMNIQRRLKLRSFHFSSSFVFFHYIYSLFYTFCCKNQKSHNMLRLTFSFLLNVLCSMCKW